MPKIFPHLGLLLSLSLLLACSGEGEADLGGSGANPAGGAAPGAGGEILGAVGGSSAGGSSTGGASTETGGSTTSSSGGDDSADGGSGGAAGGGLGSGGSDATGGNSGDGDGGTSSGGANSETPLPWLTVDGNQIKRPDGATAVLRGVSMIDIGSIEEYEGGLKERIDLVMDKNDTSGTSPGWYPSAIRLAVYPLDSDHVDSPNTYDPSDASENFYNNLLRPIVDYIRDQGAYAIIDWHHIADTGPHVETTDEFWSYIAPKFADDPNVIFELYNEPINQTGGWTELQPHMQRWYDTVRVSAPDNLVLVGTPNWSQLVGATATSPIVGTNIAYVAHMYPMHWDSQSLRDEITTAAAAAPLFLTEWGFEEGSDDVVDGTLTSYGIPFRSFVDDLGLSWIAWVAHNAWFPSMFDQNWELRVGESYMGGHAKDWLYEMREVSPAVD